jgi:triosephosphate isomerase
MKQFLIIGNWKMYKTAQEAQEFLAALLPLIEKSPVKVGLAVPFTALHAMQTRSVWIGAQNMHDALEGAFTGEISARMLKEAGAGFVLLGHSERRQIFQESNAFIQKKAKRALQEGLIPVLCVGETEQERERGKTQEVLLKQLNECLADLSKEELQKCLLAYEPVWAIGTGKSATPEMAEEAHLICRNFISEKCGRDLAQNIPILYGGSVKPDNVRTLLKMPNINGALVGGASLTVSSFAELINQGNAL